MCDMTFSLFCVTGCACLAAVTLQMCVYVCVLYEQTLDNV